MFCLPWWKEEPPSAFVHSANTPIQWPSRKDLAHPACCGAVQLSAGGARNPDVWLFPGEEGGIVVKDFAPRSRWVRASLGRWITARESRAWAALSGHPCVPRFLGKIDALAFAVEYRPGQRLSSQRGVGPGFLARLEAALCEMHARGVVHLDLRHRDNILEADADGMPVLIDFGSAIVFRPGSWAARWLLPWLAKVDHIALAKWQRKLGSSR